MFIDKKINKLCWIYLMEYYTITKTNEPVRYILVQINLKNKMVGKNDSKLH